MLHRLRHLASAPPPYSELASPLQSYLQAYASNLHLPAQMNVADLEARHAGFASSLHRNPQAVQPDVAAFLYAALRLPDCVDRVDRILIGQSEESFSAAGYSNVANWPRVQSRARRRRYHCDSNTTLAVFVTSLTDLDDLVPSLCAFQMEWNKMHGLLSRGALGSPLARGEISATAAGDELRHALGLGHADWELLRQVWTEDWDRKFTAMARAPLALTIERLPLHARYFEESSRQWWDWVCRRFNLGASTDRPVFLVSSNTHGLANLVSGFAASRERAIVDFIQQRNPDNMRQIWADGLRDPDENRANLLYYAQRHYMQFHPEQMPNQLACEESAGLTRCIPTQYPHLEAQQIELNRIDPARLDSRLTFPPGLNRSQAMILNLDYPLGLAAGHLMDEACRRFPNLRGVYVLGKSAATIGRLGDILIPSHVCDTHTQTRFQFHNHLSVRRLTPFLDKIAAFDDQKSVTVRGTFLHGRETMVPLLHDDFTGMEMEAGPYLSSLYRHFVGHPPPPNSSVELAFPPAFHLGLLHYTSDTPYNVRPSLLSHRLGPAGLEAAYASTLAILQSILDSAAASA